MVTNIKKNQFLNLGSIKKNNTDDKYIPKDYRDVASGMEKVFAQMMLEQMQKTAGKTTEESAATKFYKSMQLDQRAEAMTQNDGGLGVQAMILDQIYPEHLRTEENLKMLEAQKRSRMPLKDAVKMYEQKKEQQIIKSGNDVPDNAHGISMGTRKESV